MAPEGFEPTYLDCRSSAFFQLSYRAFYINQDNIILIQIINELYT